MDTLLSQKSLKAWAAGAAAIVAYYLGPYLSSLTAGGLVDLFGKYGVTLSDAGAAAIMGIIGVATVYFTKNKQ